MEVYNFSVAGKITYNSFFLLAFSLREICKCYILTEDSKTVHFDIDEDGHHEISTKDSQSHEGSVLFTMKLTSHVCSTIGRFLNALLCVLRSVLGSSLQNEH